MFFLLTQRENSGTIPNIMSALKLCPKCHTPKSIKCFSKSVWRRDGLNGWCKACMKIISVRYLAAKREQSRQYRAALRLEVLTHYSGGTPKCACCGIVFLEFLALDHIYGGGTKQKKEVGAHIYVWVKKHNYPAGFQVLCHNCNQALGAYGYCPHDPTRLRPV